MATDVEDRLTTLEARIKELQEQQAANTELRRIGIENGSQGVRGSLYLFAFIFTLNAAYAHFHQISAFLEPQTCYGSLEYLGLLWLRTLGSFFDIP